MKALLVAIAVAATVFGTALQAGAHDGPGNIQVISEETIEPTLVRYDVLVTFRNDGHPAKAATVTAVAEQPGAPVSTPVAMTALAEEGHFGGDVRFPTPGQWVVRFTSVSPVASTEHSVTISAAPVRTEPTVTVATTTAASSVPSTVPASENADDGGSSGAVALVVGLAAAALLAFFAWQFGVRRRRGSSSEP